MLRRQTILKHLKRWSIPLLALLISINQLRLRHQGMNSWKGGGFGMYAELHPVYTKIFVKSAKPRQNKTVVNHDQATAKLMSKVQVYPSDAFLNELCQIYTITYEIEEPFVEIWTPVFDADSISISMRLRKRFPTE